MNRKPSQGHESCVSTLVLVLPAPLHVILTFVCLRVLGSGSAWEQRLTAPTEHSRSPAIATGPVFLDQRHPLEGSSLVGSAGTVCGAGIRPGLFCPVLVLLDVRRDSGPGGEEGGGEERLLCVQPGLRSHPGHPHCRAVGERATVQTPGGEIGLGSAVPQRAFPMTLHGPLRPWVWTGVTRSRGRTAWG